MSKKILFLSSAKLTTISLGLLLVIFCMIGMSFRPVYGEDEAELVMAGPRRSHWVEESSGCSGTTYTKQSKTDYGKAVATVSGTGGTVSISGSITNGTQSISGNGTTTATLTWNTNMGNGTVSGDKDLSVHTNNVTLKADPATGKTFLGWYDKDDKFLSNSEEFTTSVTIPGGVFEQGVIKSETAATNKYGNYQSSNSPYTETFYAKFKDIDPVDLTFLASQGGSYKVTINSVETVVSSSNVVKTGVTQKVTLNATPSSGYEFVGWYMINGEGVISELSSADPLSDKQFAENASIGARFVSTSTPKFKNITKSTEHYGLRLATLAASSGDVIIPVADCTVDGSDLVSGEAYTIPAGVTLLIPYNSSNTVATTIPAKENYSGGSAPSPYRKLTLGEDVKIIVAGGGAISVASEFYGPATYSTAAEYKAGVRGPHGFIYMNSDSEIILNNGANLYAWGYITGDGEITAQNGSTVYEMMQMTDYRGGSATSDFTTGGVFPFSQYYIQNIESALHLESGATEYVRAAVTMSSKPYPATAKLIGASGALFNISSGVLTKKYDRLSDRLLITMNGNGSMAPMALKFTGLPLIGSIDLNTGDYVLPLNSNMRIEVASGKTLTLSQDLAVLPGAEVHISTGAKLLISSGYKMYAYDMAEWVGKGYVFSSLDIKPLNYVARNHVDVSGAPRSRSLVDTKIIVDGGIEATGSFFTTASGADICSTLGSNGYIKLVTKAPDNTNTQQATQSGTDITRKNIPVTSAQLHNADDTYTTTSGAPANTTINYKHGHWGWRVIWKLEDGTELKRAYYYKQPDATWISNNKPAETHPDAGTSSCTYTFNGWTQNTISTQQEIEVTASFTKTCPNYYEIIWKSEDGSATLETDASVGEGEATNFNGTVPAKATNWTTYTEYEFDGWSTEPNGGGTHYANGATPAATANATYYAHFKAIGMAASVTVSGQEPEIYKTLPEAFDAAVTKPNCTIKILNDVSGITSRLLYDRPNGICTLDLNNHTVSGAVPFTDDNNRGLLKINASGTTFTITDNSAEKEGRIENICNQNKVTYVVHLMAGTLNVHAGTIHAENAAQYASKVDANFGVSETLTACGARGIQVNAAQKLNITGGRTEAFATRNAYGIVASGNAANTTQVTITEGEIYAEAPYGAYGISCSGKLNISGGLVEAKLNDHLVDASYAATDASNNLNKHAECYAIHMSASANKTASSCYYGTLTVTGGTIKASSDLVRSYTSNVTGIRMYYSVAGMGNRNFASTSGTNAEQACAIGSVKNAEIIVQNNANYGYGILVYGHYNSYNKTNSVFKVENTTVDVKAFNYAYGVYACGGIDGTTGECFTGDVELTNCTIAAEATNATTTASYAYGAWVYAGATTIFQDKQANYYGEYATAAKMTINGGSITAKTKTHYAYTAGTNTRARSTYGPQTSVYASRTRGGNAEAYPTLIINGGTYRAISGQQHARGISSGGNTTVKDAIFHVTAGTYNTYGLYAISGKLTATNVIVNDTAKSHSSNNANVYGVLVDCSIPSGNTVQTGFAYAGEVELNNCTITAVSPSYSNARALYVNATNKVHNWTQFLADSTSYTSTWAANKSNYAALYRRVFPCTIEGRDSVSVAIAAKATVNGGTFTAKAGKASAYGAVSTQTSVPANKEVTASPVMNLYDATFTATTGTSTTAYGVQSGGPTLIEGCTIEATAGNATTYQSTASGVRALDKTTTIKNSTITATATDKAYGLEGYVEINGTHGYCWHGEFNLSEAGNTEVTAEAKTKAKTSYAIYLNATKKAIASGNFAGDYATAANATINGGTYVAKFNTSGTAYVISLGAKQTQGSVVAQPEVEVLDGFFNGATAEVGTAGVVGHMQLKGGYFVHPTNLATYAVAPKSVWTLPNTHEHYNPYKYKVTEHYTITFKNGTTQLQQNDLETGTTPTYSGTPTKDADAQYTYTFDGWSSTDGGDKLAALPAVSANATYYAHFSKTENKYTVSVAAGANGAVSPASVSGIGCETASADITATPDAGYAFNGWTLPDGVTAADGYTVASNPIRIHAIAADKTITANFVACNDINYTVKHWQQNIADDDYTEVTADQETLQGTTATATAATAKSYIGFTAQPITQETIAGGGTTVVNIYYDRETYTITWVDCNGTTIKTDQNVKYGTTPAYTGSTPTKSTDEQYSYALTGWSPAITTVSAAATYTATFSSTPRTYTVTLNTNGGTIKAGDVTEYTYGTGATLPTDVTREGYEFGGWYDNSELEGDAVTSISNTATDNKEYWAKWSAIECTITWLNWNSLPLKKPTITSTINYGSAPGYPLVGNPVPTREASDGKTYEWDGWTTEAYGAGAFYSINNLPDATGDATYYAHFRITAIDVASNSDISIDEDAEVTTTTVRVNGRLAVSSKLTTDALILEATPSSSGTISGIENITVSSKAYFDYEFDVDPWHWSAFGVPFVIDLKEAAPLKEKETELALGTDYDIIYYNTNKRAEQGPGSHCWEYVDHQAEHKLIPGVQYMIAFNKPKGHVNTVRFTKANDASINYVGDLNLVTTGEAAGDNNWNGIANPKMYYALLDAGVTECQVHDGGEIGKDGYYTYDMNDKKFFVGKSAFVQVPSGKSSVDITEATTQDAIQQKLQAPRRAKLTASQGTRYDVQIAPTEEDAADRLLVLTDEDKADEYVIVSDLAKAGVSPVRAQMWVDRYGEKLCKNTTSFINNKADYPIVISTPKAGEYDIFINDQPDDETMLYLTYDGEAIWNLSYGGYIVNLEKGTNTHYGLRIVRTPKITTGIEETSIRNGDAIRKVIVDDKVLIIRGENVYTIDGQMVK